MSCHCRTLCEHLGVWYLAQGDSEGVLTPPPTTRTPFMCCPGLKLRTLLFSTQSPTDWASTTSNNNNILIIVILVNSKYQHSLLFIYFPCTEIILCRLLQDAHEFLCQCLDQLKEEVAKVNKSLTNEAVVSSPARAGRKSGQDSVSSTARSGGLKEVGPAHIYTCPVVNNMEFEVRHTITCKRWGQLLYKGHFSVLHLRYWNQNHWSTMFEDHHLYAIFHLCT